MPKPIAPPKVDFFTWILNIARSAAIDEVRSKSYKNNKQNLSADYFVGVVEHGRSAESNVDAIGLKKLVKTLKELHSVTPINLLFVDGTSRL
ncbi:hypothetical protein ACEZ3G_12500 [Maribacter algicola]|uniref:Uncharacterized protein n=1 Tax=Meishania litoralis TaxID=3434685 RepID=A0ACC7LMR1_9FLAO